VTRDTYTGPVVVATRKVPTEIKYVNNLLRGDTTNVLAYKYAIDQSIHWANPDGVVKYINIGTDLNPIWVGNPDHYLGPIPATVHLHGGEAPAAIDGGPESWFTSDGSKVGKAFYSMGWDGTTPQNYAIYRYPNGQEAAPLWFHDHNLGATRLNVYMGLAGAYALIDPKLVLPVRRQLFFPPNDNYNSRFPPCL
jgi:FtsP/CotA-like multicopper oxidase with cupredoxin domain